MARNSPPAGDEKTVINFLKKLRAPPWVLSAIDPDSRIITTITAHDADEVREFFTRYNGKRNLYYSVNPTWKKMASKASKTDIAAIDYLLSDLDPRDDESSEAAKARYLSAIDKMKPKPTALVDSGNGLQVLLKLAKPITLAKPVMVLDDGGKRVKKFPPEIEEIIDDVENRTKLLMETLGGKAGTQNIDRILRLPGTVNLPNAKKRKEGRTKCTAKLIRFNGATCSLDDFPAAAEAADDDAGDTDAETNAKAKAYQDYREETTPKGGDQSRSGEAFRFCCDLIRLHDDIDYKTALKYMLEEEGAVGEWAKEKKKARKDRELQRTYNRASARVMEEKTPDAASASDVPLFDPWESRFNVPSFPKGILPPELEDFVEKTADNMGVDSAAVAMGIMAAISGAINHETRLKMKIHGDFEVSACLWVLLDGDLATKKSPIFKTVMGPLDRIDAENNKAYLKERIEFEKLSPEDRKKRDPPQKPRRFVIYDTTPEKFCELMAENPKGLILKRDELSGWIAEMERDGGTSRGANASRGIWLKARDSVHYGMERISRNTTANITNLSSSIFGGVQIRRLAEIKGMTSDGLLQRFITVLMKFTREFDRDDCEVDIASYDDLIRNIVKQNYSTHHFELRSDAYTHMREIHRKLFEIKLVADGISEGFAEHVGKLPGFAGNLTLILHYAYHSDHWSPGIEASTVKKVGRLIFEFILPHAVSFYRLLEQKSSSGETIQKVASWILTSKVERFTTAQLTANVSSFRGLGPFDINRRLGPLVATGWIKPHKPTPDNHTWTVATRVHTEFAARKEEEEDRKQKLAKLMNGPRRPK